MDFPDITDKRESVTKQLLENIFHKKIHKETVAPSLLLKTVDRVSSKLS